jgi:hypothetical protein
MALYHPPRSLAGKALRAGFGVVVEADSVLNNGDGVR